LIAIAQLIYIRNIYSFKVKPSVLSWTGWSILMGVGVFSQIINDGFDWSQAGLLLSTFGCLFIALFSISINNFSLIKSDWWFLLLGFLSIGVYFVSKDSLITTLFAITADFLLGIPTLQKAFKFPNLEKSKAWAFGAFSSVLAISICIGDPIVYWLFPVYLLLYNLTMIILSNRKESIQS